MLSGEQRDTGGQDYVHSAQPPNKAAISKSLTLPPALKTPEPDLLAPGEQFEKFTEHALTERARLRRMPVRVAQDVFELMLRT